MLGYALLILDLLLLGVGDTAYKSFAWLSWGLERKGEIGCLFIRSAAVLGIMTLVFSLERLGPDFAGLVRRS